VKFLNKYSDKTLRIFIVIITLYCFFLSGIPLYKAAISERLTIDDSRKEHIKNDNNENQLKISEILPGGVSEEAGLKVGDIIVSVNGVKFQDYLDFIQTLNKTTSGPNAVYTILRNGEILDINVKVYRYFHLLFFIFSALGYGFLINGFLVGYSKPKDFASQIFFLLGCTACLGLILYGGTWYYIKINFFYINYLIGLVFFYPLSLHFFTIFPITYKFRRRKLKIFTAYAYVVLLETLMIINPDNFFTDRSLVSEIIGYSALLYLALGIFLFIKSYFRITEANLRKSLRIILYGFLIGGLGFVYYFFLFLPILMKTGLNPLLRVPTILVLAIPMSFGYSIFKYRILDTEFIIKKGLVFGIVTAVIVGLYLFLVYVIDSLLIKYFTENRQLLIIGMIIIITFTFDYVNKRARMFVDRQFYRERYNYRKSLLKFSEELPYMKNIKEVINKLGSSINDTMGVTSVKVFLREKEYTDIIMKTYDSNDLQREQDVDLRNSMFDALFVKSKGPKLLYEVNLKELELTEKQKALIRNEKVVLSIPILIKNKLIGAINFGEKPSGKAYSDEDIDLLNTLASQTAIAFENSRLQKEELNKQKIEEELQIAKNIQMDLVPKEDAAFEGLDISGLTQPAKSIGGDFYDLIKLSDKKILIIVADVAGKGIPAALYMSKVQAMIKFAAKIFKTPKEILVEINKQIYEKFEKKTFVTMIIALFDLEKMKVSIARAGHTPVIFSRNGKLEILKNQGMGLGLDCEQLFNSNLDETEMDIKHDNLFLFYSDGLSEAMNPKKEEYGLERILKMLEETRNDRSKIINENLFNSVNDFRKSAEQNDDVTYVIVKVN
jgi:sigma-B regulation protein RsbU (phosphoserine phosphatase)